MPKKVVAFVDGFNLFHALDYLETGPDHHRYHRYKWLNLWKLAKLFVHGDAELKAVLYYTTLATWDIGKTERHKLYIRALESEGVEVIYGRFKLKDRKCKLCGNVYKGREEKETDVNMALGLYDLAVKGQYDRAIVISGDSDLLPALRIIHATFPGKEMGLVIPIGKSSEYLKRYADFSLKMREHHLASSLFADPLTLKDGTVLNCPPTWK